MKTYLYLDPYSDFTFSITQITDIDGCIMNVNVLVHFKEIYKMQITITIDGNDYEQMKKFQLMMNATKMANFISEVRNVIFRPARKHGYSDKVLQDAIEVADSDSTSNGEFIISKLEDMWTELVEKHGIDESGEYGEY